LLDSTASARWSSERLRANCRKASTRLRPDARPNHALGVLRLVLTLAVPAQPTLQQPARLRNKIDIGHELGGFAAPLQDDLAAVEGFELGTMADADDGRSFEAGENFHQFILARGIERRGCLVEDDGIRPMQHYARKSQALLLAARQGLVPGPFLLEAVGEMSVLAEFLASSQRGPTSSSRPVAMTGRRRSISRDLSLAKEG